MGWIKDAWNWLFGKVKAVFTIVAERVRSDALAILNDGAIQAAAIGAVEAAIREGLTNEKAWASARDHLVDTLKESGRVLKDSAINAVLELAYYCVKNRA